MGNQPKTLPRWQSQAPATHPTAAQNCTNHNPNPHNRTTSNMPKAPLHPHHKIFVPRLKQCWQRRFQNHEQQRAFVDRFQMCRRLSEENQLVSRTMSPHAHPNPSQASACNYLAIAKGPPTLDRPTAKNRTRMTLQIMHETRLASSHHAQNKNGQSAKDTSKMAKPSTCHTPHSSPKQHKPQPQPSQSHN
jgi:hypothetical protein